MFSSDQVDGKATGRLCRISFISDKIKRTLSREKCKEALASYEGQEQRTTASTEFNALAYVMFSDTNIEVYLHKRFYLGIG